MIYSGSLAFRRRFTSASISRLKTSTLKAGRVTLGSFLTHTGLSHSCDRATRSAPAPRAQTISVPPANSETMRIKNFVICYMDAIPTAASGAVLPGAQENLRAKDRHNADLRT